MFYKDAAHRPNIERINIYYSSTKWLNRGYIFVYTKIEPTLRFYKLQVLFETFFAQTNINWGHTKTVKIFFFVFF